jgi:oxygen-independent coproporphyrinogen-3 oxidase
MAWIVVRIGVAAAVSAVVTSSSVRVPPEGAAEVPTPWPHLYVHVPFCGRRCSYCDFAIAVRRNVPVSEYIDAIMAEMVTRGIALDSGVLRTLYLGGGTPSKLGGTGLARLIQSFAHLAGVDKFSTSLDKFELTIEVNPEDVSAEAARAWVAAGVNRASIGVQSFEPGVLRWMHRDHTPEQVGEAVRILRGEGVQELSLDLIFALPSSVERSWTHDLDVALSLTPDHLSFYGLTVEPTTPLGRWVARGEESESPEERYEAEFLEADRVLTGAGFEHYEVSNYGLPGKRARHNSSYWSGAPYLGLGPSAHGFDGRVRRWNRKAYADWLAVVGRGDDPVAGSEVIGASERLAEEVYLGLRTTDGLSIRENDLKMVTPWIDAGWGALGPDAATGGVRLRLTPSGWLRLDSLAAAIAAHRTPA